MRLSQFARTLGFLIIVSGGLALSSTALARDYYVDIVAGSDNQTESATAGDVTRPYKTPGKVAGLTNLSPGDTVYLKNGTYTSFTLTRSGTSDSARITWKNYPGHFPEVKLSTGSWGAITVKASYQTIDGLTVTGNNDNVTLAQAEADAMKSVSTLFLSNPGNSGKPDINPNTGLAVTADMPNPTYVGPGYGGDGKFNNNGIVIQQDSKTVNPAHHLTVRNSILRKFGCGGVAVLGADYTVIENNKIYENAWYSRYGCSGGTIFNMNENSDDPFTGYRTKVIGNMFWNNRGKVWWLEKEGESKVLTGGPGYSDGNGFILDFQYKDANGQDYEGRTLIANNLTVNNGGSGIHTLTTPNVDVFNNTAYMNADVMTTYADIYGAYTSNTRFRNNIVYARTGRKVNSNSSNTNVTYDYNIYYDGTATPNITTNTKGANDIVADPQFVNPLLTPCTPDANTPTVTCTADFSLKSTSLALNNGVQIAGTTPTTDIKNVSRLQGSGVDRGAYELIVTGKPLITSSNTKTGTIGNSLSYTIIASNTPTSYAATGLPSWLTFNATTGVFTGTPTVAGISNVTVTASNASGADSKAVQIIVTAASVLPKGWKAPAMTTDAVIDSVVESSGAWSLKGRSGKTFGNTDSVIGAWKDVTGDFSFSVRIADMNGTANLDPESFAGIMIRGSADANAQQASVVLTAKEGRGISFIRRSKVNDPTWITAGAVKDMTMSSIKANAATTNKGVWVRIVRQGDNVQGFSSADGTTWNAIRKEVLPALPATIQLGLVASTEGGTEAISANFSDVKLVDAAGTALPLTSSSDVSPVSIGATTTPATTAATPATSAAPAAPATAQ
jgi:regulation of enolase protein 1 (concanavalin A-like superfamily)